MGISGIFKELGPGQRQSIAKLTSDFYVQHNRCLRLAIDISIWLFQIQSGKGGSNPALRTFYYRLLRLLSLNIHPLFVFDGPNKPLYKRNKRVGAVQNGKGSYQKVASVPEFLAKQLLKQFGFPWHVAPGEAEAECALLQQEAVVDAVLSEDVDTIMFGCSLTLRSWTPEGTTKTPTHVNIYKAKDLKSASGLDKDGMVLVALMSGGDYLPDGIPQCGIKLACDAARAGFGKDLCALKRSDKNGLNLWKERLEHQIRTNEAKYFSRKLKDFKLPEDFPNTEVLGWYTKPCVSSKERIQELRSQVHWDLDMDFAALRAFAGDAFDWRNLGGAKKFIRNLAPALLMREFRTRAEAGGQLSQKTQAAEEKDLVVAIHGKRNHFSTDGELEFRISFTPMSLVPIDLSQEPEDDAFIPAGGNDSDSENEFPMISSTPAPEEDEPSSPRKRSARPYDPAQPEKLWVISCFLKLGCPLTVEDYEASTRDPRAFMKQRRQAKAALKGKGNSAIGAGKGSKSQKRSADLLTNAITQYATVAKFGVGASSSESFPRWHERNLHSKQAGADRALKEISPDANDRSESHRYPTPGADITTAETAWDVNKPPEFYKEHAAHASTFVMPGSQGSAPGKGALDHNETSFRPPSQQSTTNIQIHHYSAAAEGAWQAIPPRSTRAAHKGAPQQQSVSYAINSTKRDRFFAIFADPASRPLSGSQTSVDDPRTPQRKQSKRKTPDLLSPAGYRQESMFRYCSVTPREPERAPNQIDTIDLVSSSPCKSTPRPSVAMGGIVRAPSLEDAVANASQDTVTRIAVTPPLDWTAGDLPATVTKRRKRVPLRKSSSAPAASIATSSTSADDDVVYLTSSPLHAPEARLPPAYPPEQDSYDGATYWPDAVSTSQQVNDTSIDGGGFIVERDDIVSEALEIGDHEAMPMIRAVTADSREHASATTNKPSAKPSTPAAIPQTSSQPAKTACSREIAASRRSPRFPEQIKVTAADSRGMQLPKMVSTDRSDGTNTKRSIVLRDSLEGAWKEVVRDSPNIAKAYQGSRKIKRTRAWSEVECLDLT